MPPLERQCAISIFMIVPSLLRQQQTGIEKPSLRSEAGIEVFTANKDKNHGTITRKIFGQLCNCRLPRRRFSCPKDIAFYTSVKPPPYPARAAAAHAPSQ